MEAREAKNKKTAQEKKAKQVERANAREEAKLLMGLGSVNICASCHLTPDADGSGKDVIMTAVSSFVISVGPGPGVSIR